MAKVNDIEHNKLWLATVKPDASKLNDMELDYLGVKLGSFTGVLNERWMKEFILNGGDNSLSWNENARMFMVAAGITRAPISSMWKQFWLNFV